MNTPSATAYPLWMPVDHCQNMYEIAANCRQQRTMNTGDHFAVQQRRLLKTLKLQLGCDQEIFTKARALRYRTSHALHPFHATPEQKTLGGTPCAVSQA